MLQSRYFVLCLVEIAQETRRLESAKRKQPINLLLLSMGWQVQISLKTEVVCLGIRIEQFSAESSLSTHPFDAAITNTHRGHGWV
jgi:hypothetical protein